MVRKYEDSRAGENGEFYIPVFDNKKVAQVMIYEFYSGKCYQKDQNYIGRE